MTIKVGTAHPTKVVRVSEPIPHSLSWIDGTILVTYVVILVAWGCGFARRSQTADDFMSAGRGFPGWVVGMSMFGSFVSSITFLGNPGVAFAGNWNTWVFALSLPFAAWVATTYFVPHYRALGSLSAYEHLEARFGAWARTYCVVCYLLTQIWRLGSGTYLLAVALDGLTGLNLATLIILCGIVITIYPFFGGTEGVIWTGVVQTAVLVGGAALALGILLWDAPGGPVGVVATGWSQGKLSLGPYEGSLATQTFWATLIFGFFTNLQNFGIDQSYVQRYQTAATESAAQRSVWMSALCYVPLSAGFLLIGTALFAYYAKGAHALPPDLKADQVFPYFLQTGLPLGIRGLLLAAVCSSAMDSNLNCCATLYLCDIHLRYFRPRAEEREKLLVLRGTILTIGILAMAAALSMMSVKTLLDHWWKSASIFSGGMLGLYLLGRFVPRATPQAALCGTVAGLGMILWITLLPRTETATDWWRSPFHAYWAIVLGTSTIFLVGMLLSPPRGAKSPAKQE